MNRNIIPSVLNKTYSRPYPIVLDTLVSFTAEANCLFKSEGTQPASYDEFGKFQIFE